jgi:hypothetical protein
MFFCLTHIALTLFSIKLYITYKQFIISILCANQDLFFKIIYFFSIKMQKKFVQTKK